MCVCVGGLLSEPAANLPSLLRCIIQCFSHNSLRFAGLSFPQPCGRQSANMKRSSEIYSVVPPGSAAPHSPSCSYDLFSFFIRGVRVGPQRTSRETFLSLSSGPRVAQLGRGSVSAWLWVVTVTLEQLHLPLVVSFTAPCERSQGTATLPWPQ